MNDYPHVQGEFSTIRKVLTGYSLSRYGDGELKMAHGRGYSRQDGNPILANELRKILVTPHPRCIVGIPTMNPSGPKYPNWLRHRSRFLAILSPDMVYYSAFVSRPDSSPWIATKEYGELVQQIWAGKKAVVMCERKGSMFSAVNRAAAKTIHVECPRRGAYDHIDRLEEEVLAEEPEVVIMAAGPAATCMANRLAIRGIQAVDLGSAGGFIRKMLEL